MADNIICPADMPRAISVALAIDHAEHGACFYRWRAEFGEYERIAPHAVWAASYSRGVVEAFLARDR